jgi:hypothetical protein
LQQQESQVGQQNVGPPEGSKLISRQAVKTDQYAEQAYLTARVKRVADHFPNVMGVDDFLNRLEIALFAYGFTGENSIGRF